MLIKRHKLLPFFSRALPARSPSRPAKGPSGKYSKAGTREDGAEPLAAHAQPFRSAPGRKLRSALCTGSAGRKQGGVRGERLRYAGGVPRANPRCLAMLDHVSITVSDLRHAERFYDAVMAALGVPKVGATDVWLGYGQRCDADRPDLTYLAVKPGPAPEAAHGRHWCFKAPSRAAVERLLAAGLGAGGSDDGPAGSGRDTIPATTPRS